MLRLKPETSVVWDSIRANVNRVNVAMSGVTTILALQKADQDLAEMGRQIAVLRMALRRESADERKRERDGQEKSPARAGAR